MNDRIMIIEDNENIRIELMTFFERNGFLWNSRVHYKRDIRREPETVTFGH